MFDLVTYIFLSEPDFDFEWHSDRYHPLHPH